MKKEFVSKHDWNNDELKRRTTWSDSNINGGYCNLGHDYAGLVSSYSTVACHNNVCGKTIDEMEVWVQA